MDRPYLSPPFPRVGVASSNVTPERDRAAGGVDFIVKTFDTDLVPSTKFVQYGGSGDDYVYDIVGDPETTNIVIVGSTDLDSDEDTLFDWGVPSELSLHSAGGCREFFVAESRVGRVETVSPCARLPCVTVSPCCTSPDPDPDSGRDSGPHGHVDPSPSLAVRPELHPRSCREQGSSQSCRITVQPAPPPRREASHDVCPRTRHTLPRLANTSGSTQAVGARHRPSMRTARVRWPRD